MCASVYLFSSYRRFGLSVYEICEPFFRPFEPKSLLGGRKRFFANCFIIFYLLSANWHLNNATCSQLSIYSFLTDVNRCLVNHAHGNYENWEFFSHDLIGSRWKFCVETAAKFSSGFAERKRNSLRHTFVGCLRCSIFLYSSQENLELVCFRFHRILSHNESVSICWRT